MHNRINFLTKKYKNKRIAIYGAGLNTKELLEKFDISRLNIIGITDYRFLNTKEDSFMGYKAINPCELQDYNIEVILISIVLEDTAVRTLNNIFHNANQRFQIEPLSGRNFSGRIFDFLLNKLAPEVNS